MAHLTGRYFTADLMDDIQSQMAEIQSALVAAGYTSPDIVTEDVEWSYLPSKIRELFNTQEANTQKIDAVADWVNPYSALFEWQKKNGMIFNRVNRWFLWADFNAKVINNEQRKPTYLIDKYSKDIYDSDGEKILTLEGYFTE